MNNKLSKQMIQYFIFLYLSAYSSILACHELDTYMLVTSKGDKICEHMKNVFNTSFQDINYDQAYNSSMKILFPEAKKALGDEVEKSGMSKKLLDINHTFHPMSVEFSRVKWEISMYMVNFNQPDFYSKYRPFIFTYLDVDNDGNNELVVKTEFMTDYKGSESLYIFEKSIDLNNKNLSAEDIAQGEHENRPRVIYGHSILRIFILDGMPFLADFAITNSAYPEEIIISKYIKGGVVFPGEETSLVKEQICRFAHK